MIYFSDDISISNGRSEINFSKANLLPSGISSDFFERDEIAPFL